jgi:hypothetical protein
MITFAALRKGLAVAAALAFLTLGTNYARAGTIVQFTTTGVFGTTTNVNDSIYSETGNDPIILFESANITANVPINGFALSNLGLFRVVGAPADGNVSSAFTLTVNQTNPSNDSDSFSGILTGTLSMDSSQAMVINLNPTSFELGLVTYELERTTIFLPAANDNPNTANIGVILTVVPEPASLAMVGLGLIGIPGLMFVQRRRRTTTV